MCVCVCARVREKVMNQVSSQDVRKVKNLARLDIFFLSCWGHRDLLCRNRHIIQEGYVASDHTRQMCCTHAWTNLHCCHQDSGQQLLLPGYVQLSDSSCPFMLREVRGITLTRSLMGLERTAVAAATHW